MVTYLDSLAQLCCGEGRDTANKYCFVLRECSEYINHTGFATLQTSWVHTAQASRVLSKGSVPSGCFFFALSRSKPFRFLGVPQGSRPRLALHFVPFLGLSSSGDRVLSKCTVLGGPCVLFTSFPVSVTQSPGRAMRAQSQVCLCLLRGVDLRL